MLCTEEGVRLQFDNLDSVTLGTGIISSPDLSGSQVGILRMQPFTALLGILAGSLVSMAFGLAVVLFVFWLLQDTHPRFAAELPAIAAAFGMFLVLSVLGVSAFLGTLRERSWRYGPLIFLWVGLALVGRYYWPD